jgi:hypothetical protein
MINSDLDILISSTIVYFVRLFTQHHIRFDRLAAKYCTEEDCHLSLESSDHALPFRTIARHLQSLTDSPLGALPAPILVGSSPGSNSRRHPPRPSHRQRLSPARCGWRNRRHNGRSDKEDGQSF